MSDVIHLKFKTQRALASTFLRFQEYYESPEFQGKVFTLGQFRQWYTKRNGAFSYHTDWSGFNVPSWVLRPFYDGLFDPLTKAEKEFLDLFRGKEGKFYIIGTHLAGDATTIDHELRHAAFYIDEDYRRRSNNCIVLMPDENYKVMAKFLTDLGYHKDVHIDEMQAYIGADAGWLMEDKKIAVDPETLKDLTRLFADVTLNVKEIKV